MYKIKREILENRNSCVNSIKSWIDHSPHEGIGFFFWTYVFFFFCITTKHVKRIRTVYTSIFLVLRALNLDVLCTVAPCAYVSLNRYYYTHTAVGMVVAVFFFLCVYLNVILVGWFLPGDHRYVRTGT